jgi:hypothetical protein
MSVPNGIALSRNDIFAPPAGEIPACVQAAIPAGFDFGTFSCSPLFVQKEVSRL